MPKKRKSVRIKRQRRTAKRSALDERTQSTILGIIEIGVAVLSILSLKSEAGPLGTILSSAHRFFFGAYGMLFPTLLLITGLYTLFGDREREVRRTFGLLLCTLAFLGIVHLAVPLQEIGLKRDALGGALGFLVTLPILLFTSRIVGYVFFVALVIIGLVLAFESTVRSIIQTLKESKAPKRKKGELSIEEFLAQEMPMPPRVRDTTDDAAESTDDDEEDLIEEDQEAPSLNIVRPSFAVKAAKAKSPTLPKVVKRDELEMTDTRFEEWTFPALDLLDSAQSHLAIDDSELKMQAKRIEEKLGEFGIQVTVRDARPGPTVTQFTLEPAEGVKLSSIANLKDDLALALAAQSLRIEAPIPGKSLVGIEMPNSHRTTVHLREILESIPFNESASALTLPLGRDVSGEAVVVPLDGMPHLLIAGATGSGKSVCMNVFLTALLYQNAPHELKFILVDPKRVELMPFNGIPHLLTPVITESDKALQALRWAVAEMGRRLHRFSEAGVRNIAEYNEKQTDEGQRIPRVVIVIDELADLMMRQFRRDTETMVVRIAQMARATGMHLIIATQRPSVDVITGLIKANIPTRIAFRTVSSVDSRTILDGVGAEDLLGKGDMLLMTATTAKPVRIQGIFISTKEAERVINAVKIAGGGRITEQIGIRNLDEEEEEGADEEGVGDEESTTTGGMPALLQQDQIDLEADDNGGDDMFFEAVRVVKETGKASASLLQRQLKVGYARAARLLDIMEEKGMVGPADGAKPRKLYMATDVTSKYRDDEDDLSLSA